MTGKENQQLTYLVSGGNRGIGMQLVSTLLARNDAKVIATVRDPTNSTSASLKYLPAGHNSRLIVVKIDSTSPIDATDAVSGLTEFHSIKHLDVEHISVNAIGPFLLLKATLLLLKGARNTGKFVVVGSAFGSIGGMEKRPFPMGIYGASKALVHHLTRKIHQENEEIIAFVIDPGIVQSDAGNEGAIAFDMKEAPVTLEDSAHFIIAKTEEATRGNTSGRFLTIEGG